MTPFPGPPEAYNALNPDHTGWAHPGLLRAIRRPSRKERSVLSKRIYYQFFVPRPFPFLGYKQVKPLKGLPCPEFFMPCELHRAEGKVAQIWRLQSLVGFVLNPHDVETSSRRNVHIYMADDDNELPLDTTMDDILQGKFGCMSAGRPLRIVYIPGVDANVATRFPGGKKNTNRTVCDGPPSYSLSGVTNNVERLAFETSVCEQEPPPPYDFEYHVPSSDKGAAY